MKLKITKDQISAFVVDLFLIMVLMIFSMKDWTSYDSYKIIWGVSTIIYISLLFTWKKISKDFINFFTLILIISYCYYFGQYLLYSLDIRSIYAQYTILNTYSPKAINSTSIKVLLNLILLHVAVCIFYDKRKGGLDKEYYENKIDEKAFQILANIIIIVSFISECLVLAFKIQLNMSAGYAVALNTDFNALGHLSYIVNFLSTLFIPAVFSEFILTKDKRSNWIVWIIYLIYLVLYFLSGSRFEAAVSLVGVFLMYHYYYKEINKKKIFLIVLIALISLYLFSVMSSVRRISNYRNSGNFSEIVKQAITDSGENNFLTSTISEAGLQILSATTVYEHCPNDESFTYGLYYMGGVIRIIPNVFGGENRLITKSLDAIFTPYFTKTYGMGSSFIAEAYYNFGYLGLLMMIVYGYGIAFLCNRMDQIRINKNRSVLTYFIFYIASSALFCVRSDARMIPREIVFYYWAFVVAVKVIRGTFLKPRKLK